LHKRKAPHNLPYVVQLQRKTKERTPKVYATEDQ